MQIDLTPTYNKISRKLEAILRSQAPVDTGHLQNSVMVLYDHYAQSAKMLMEKKNHDYGEAWRDMRISSLTDLILMKILRVKQIEDNDGHTIISEGIDANYYDMLNYAVFALILSDVK